MTDEEPEKTKVEIIRRAERTEDLPDGTTRDYVIVTYTSDKGSGRVVIDKEDHTPEAEAEAIKRDLEKRVVELTSEFIEV